MKHVDVKKKSSWAIVNLNQSMNDEREIQFDTIIFYLFY